MRYVSLFSGIEAASVAAEPLGWEPVCFCEIDEFPSAVLAHHYPEVPNLGDITKVDWKEVITKHGPVDVVVGGSPCQSFSVAGKREGLEGASGLMFEYIRAVSEILPRYWVWENVPGALSSSGGGDFKCFLREMAGIRGPGGERYGIGWRVLDAQFFGVAQRRRRLFAVGVLGDFGGPAEILFESEGLRWNTPSSREKRKALTTDARSRATNAGWAIPENVINRPTGGSNGSMAISGISPTLRASNSVPATLAFAQNQRDEVRLLGGDGDVAGTVSAQTWGTHKNETLLVDCLTPWDVQSKRVHGEDGVAPTLPSGGTEGMTIQPVVMASTHTNAEIDEGGVTPTLMAHAEKQPPVLAMATTCSPRPARPMGASSSSTTRACEGDGSFSTQDGSGPSDVTVIDRAAFNQGGAALYVPHIEQTEVMDTLVARGPHAVGYSRATERSTSGPSVPETSRESGASLSVRGR